MLIVYSSLNSWYNKEICIFEYVFNIFWGKGYKNEKKDKKERKKEMIVL